MTCIFEGNDDVSIVARPVLTQSAVNGLLCRIMCLSETHIYCALANMQKSAVARIQISFWVFSSYIHSERCFFYQNKIIEALNIWIKLRLSFKLFYRTFVWLFSNTRPKFICFWINTNPFCFYFIKNKFSNVVHGVTGLGGQV